MNKRILLPALIPFLALVSCKPNYVTGSGNIKSDTRSVAGFSKIEISAPVKAIIHMQEGATPSIQMSGYENLLKQIKTEVKENTLFITVPDGVNIESDKDVQADITLPSLVHLSLTGSADANILGNLTGNEFGMEITGVSDVVADNINVSNFDVTITGAGNLNVKQGKVQKANYAVTGSGDINAFPLLADLAEAAVSGAGDIELSAMQKLDVSITGAGDVRYKGHPTVSSQVTGAGSLDDAN